MLSCTNPFLCCHALIYTLEQQCIVLCMFTTPLQKGISIVLFFMLFFVHHASFQGLYLSEVIANTAELQASTQGFLYHNAKWNLKCKLQSCNIECESPKA